jgi:Na+-driven multidrug efflux pump
MIAGDGGGDTAAAIGAAFVAVGILVGKKYGANAERKYDRILTLLGLAALAIVVALVLIYWAIASAG